MRRGRPAVGMLPNTQVKTATTGMADLASPARKILDPRTNVRGRGGRARRGDGVDLGIATTPSTRSASSQLAVDADRGGDAVRNYDEVIASLAATSPRSLPCTGQLPVTRRLLGVPEAAWSS